METIKLNITRKAAWAGGAVPYAVHINGEKVGSLMIRQSLVQNVSADKPIVVKISAASNNLNQKLTKAAKPIEREVAIHPQLVKNGQVDIIVHSVLKMSMWNPIEIVVDVQY